MSDKYESRFPTLYYLNYIQTQRRKVIERLEKDIFHAHDHHALNMEEIKCNDCTMFYQQLVGELKVLSEMEAFILNNN